MLRSARFSLLNLQSIPNGCMVDCLWMPEGFPFVPGRMNSAGTVPLKNSCGLIFFRLYHFS